MTFSRVEPLEIVSSRTTLTPTSQNAAFGAGCGFSLTGAPASTVYPTANLAIYIPFHVNERLILYEVFWANGTTSAANRDVGVYDMAGNRLASTGTTAAGATSTWINTNWTDYTLEPGQYYMAYATNSNTDTPVAWAPAAGLCESMGICSQTTAFALPNPATMARTATAYIPMFGFNARSVAL